MTTARAPHLSIHDPKGPSLGCGAWISPPARIDPAVSVRIRLIRVRVVGTPLEKSEAVVSILPSLQFDRRSDPRSAVRNANQGITAIRQTRRAVAQLGRAADLTNSLSVVTGRRYRGLSDLQAASSSLAGSSVIHSSARMGVGRAPPGTVAQQRTTELGVAAPGPIARRGPDGADTRRRDAGATPAGPGTTSRVGASIARSG